MISFFFDIDGTILPFGLPAPESAVEAIRKLRKLGHRAFLSTGRSPAEVPASVYEIGFDGGVFSAGADVVVDGKRIYKAVMTKPERDSLLSYCRSRNFRVLVQTENGTYVSAEALEFWKGKMLEYAGREVALSSIIISDTVPEEAEVTKLLYVTDSYSLDAVRADLGGRFSVVDNTVGLPSDMMGEIVMNGITKATGIDRVLEYLGEDISTAAAFGDGANDIEMVEHAAVGIAMGNASEELKRVASWVAPSVEHDGLKAGIEYVLSVLKA